MDTNECVKIVVFVPETHADLVRNAMGNAGAGLVGNYKHTSFSVKGIGRFIPLESAHPNIGEIWQLTEVVEERIETVCYKKDVDNIIEAIKKVHPYEEIAIDIYPLLSDPYKNTYNHYKK